MPACVDAQNRAAEAQQLFGENVEHTGAVKLAASPVDETDGVQVDLLVPRRAQEYAVEHVAIAGGDAEEIDKHGMAFLFQDYVGQASSLPRLSKKTGRLKAY